MIRSLRCAATALLTSLGFAATAGADSANLHTFHCIYGCPVGAPANDDLIVREIYTLASNPVTKLADWVAYRITPQTIGPSQDRVWSADPWLAPDETLDPNDYDGASAALHIDRGHQAPLAAFSGTPFWLETDILSNITPQASALNQGAWQRLEAREMALSQSENTAVYVLTGPLFERVMAALPAGPPLQRVPSGYWKVVATADGRATAFLFDQQTQRDADYCATRVSVTTITLRSRLLLFPGPETPKWKPLDAELGCTKPALPEAPGETINTR